MHLLIAAAAGGLCLLAPNAAHAEEIGANPVISRQAELAAAAVIGPDGYRVVPVASEPNLANPTAFCFDPAGRIFVAETYRVGKGVEDNRNHPEWLDDDLAARTVSDRRAYMQRHMGDKISQFTEASEQVRVLEDRDHDGRYESSSVFADSFRAVEDGAAAGVIWANDRLLFACIPTLWELRDADGNGRAEQATKLADGFGVHVGFYGHDLHGLCAGPDGKIYFSIGDRGLHVTTPDGELANPDSGAVLRCNLDGTDLEIFATGLRNPQELAFNEFGDLFTVDNNSDSGDRARLVHIVEGLDAGWRMAYQYLADRGPFRRERIWETQNDDQPPSIVPPLAHLSDGPSGLVFYPGTGLPAENAGAFYLCDFRFAAATSRIRRFWLKPRGATYELAKDDVFVDRVLATDCDFGPDGRFYILDWIDGGEGTGMGRVHRLEGQDAGLESKRIATQEALLQLPSRPMDVVFALFAHPDMRVRMAAQRRVVAAGAESASRLVEIASDRSAQLLARLHAIWALGELAETSPQLFGGLAALCNDDHAEVRAQAAKTLGRADQAPAEQRRALSAALAPLITDPAPRVRLFAAIAAGKLADRAALQPLLQLAREVAERDPTLRHAAAMGIAGSQSPEVLAASLTDEATIAERLTIAVALGRQKSPLVAKLLHDRDERVVLAAARAIWDTPIPAAYDELAAVLDNTPSATEPLVRRALAANLALRTSAHLNRMVHFGLRNDVSAEMRRQAWELVRHWASPSPRDSVHGDWRPLLPRPPEAVVAALQAELPRIQQAAERDPVALIVAAELGVNDAFAPLQKVVADGKFPADVRARAVAAFASANEAATMQAIDTGLAAREDDVRNAARELWANRFPAQAVDALISAAESGTIPERQAAIDALGRLDVPQSRTAIDKWMEQVERGACPSELLIEVLEAASKSSDSSLRNRRDAFVSQAASQEPLERFSGCLNGGDARRGRQIFENNATLACRRCHSVNPGEPLVGPSLAGLGATRSRGELLESIVAPNAKIVEGFQTTVLQLDSGVIVTGIVRREDDSRLVLVDADAKEIEVDRQTIEERAQGKSAMPDDVVEQISQRELRDLIEFLSQLKESSPTNGAAAP